MRVITNNDDSFKGTIFEKLDPADFKNGDGSPNLAKLQEGAQHIADIIAASIEQTPGVLKQYNDVLEKGSPQEVEDMVNDAFNKGIRS
jgi:hypothetical protein